MPVADFAHGVKTPFFAMVNHTNDGLRTKPGTQTASTAKPASAAQTAATSDSGKSFFDDLLDVVNPLQHLPIVGTVYRAMTGDKIGDVEKVAGDTLYGGPLGLASSLADLAFEKITGKDFGDTVMSWLGVDDKNIAVAAKTPAAPAAKALTTTIASAPSPAIAKLGLKPATPVQAAAAQPPTAQSKLANTIVDIDPQTDALLASLQRNGVSGPMQTQALDAYRRTMTMNANTAAAVN